jgi:hypothetical protein
MGKAERIRARAAGQTKAERRRARPAGQTKAERRRARAARGRGAGPATPDLPGAPGEHASLEERIEWRLARIEEDVASQSERSEELLDKTEEMIHGASEPSRPTASEPEREGGGD